MSSNNPDTQSSPPRKTPSLIMAMYVGVAGMANRVGDHILRTTQFLSQNGYGTQPASEWVLLSEGGRLDPTNLTISGPQI